MNVPSEPIRGFISDCGSLHHPTSQELFDKMYRHQVETERQISNALSYVGSLGVISKIQNRQLNERENEDSEVTSSDKDTTSSPSVVPPSSSSIVPIAHHHLQHMTLLEENVLATRVVLTQLADTTGEHRTPMSTNMALLKKMGERLTEAKRIAMARGLVRRMNDDVDVKGERQVVGEVNKVDVSRIEVERQEILGLMEVSKARHAALLDS